MKIASVSVLSFFFLGSMIDILGMCGLKATKQHQFGKLRKCTHNLLSCRSSYKKPHSSIHDLPSLNECLFSSQEDLAKLGNEIHNSLAIFCVATYGEGDPTDNAQELHTWLKEGKVRLDSLKYTVFGLGNKTYEHFNAMGQFIDKRLEELGATRVFMAGEGDDDGK